MPPITLDDAAGLTRTGDVWLFRGRTPADRAIQVATNSPVNHVGMSVVLEDLPPLMWHAELGRSLPDLWSGTRHRGVATARPARRRDLWSAKYGQRAWLRQLTRRPPGDGGRGAAHHRAAGRHAVPVHRRARVPLAAGPGTAGRPPPEASLETAYCAEVLAATYQAMGLLSGRRRTNWYDAGRFWSGDDLRLAGGYRLCGEVAVTI